MRALLLWYKFVWYIYVHRMSTRGKVLIPGVMPHARILPRRVDMSMGVTWCRVHCGDNVTAVHIRQSLCNMYVPKIKSKRTAGTLPVLHVLVAVYIHLFLDTYTIMLLCCTMTGNGIGCYIPPPWGLITIRLCRGIHMHTRIGIILILACYFI